MRILTFFALAVLALVAEAWTQAATISQKITILLAIMANIDHNFCLLAVVIIAFGILTCSVDLERIDFIPEEYKYPNLEPCGAGWYNPAEQICYNNSKVGKKCGTRTEEYDPDKYECGEVAGEANYIYLKNKPKDSGGKIYKAVLLGSQVWLAENLNYVVEGSTCYENSSNCNTYGRLYNWETAMDICPSGWHLPSGNEWQTLAGYTSNLENSYGFAPLLGGNGYDSGFSDIGESGWWWSATEDEDYAEYFAYGYYNYEGFNGIDFDKQALLSVRCVKDN